MWGNITFVTYLINYREFCSVQTNPFFQVKILEEIRSDSQFLLHHPTSNVRRNYSKKKPKINMQKTNGLLKKSVFLTFWVGCVKDMHDFLLPSLRFTSTLHWLHLQWLAHPFNFKVSLKMCSFLEELQETSNMKHKLEKQHSSKSY